MNGNYTPWTSWTACSASCGSSDANQTRERACTNPAPLNGGSNCEMQSLGPAVENQPCGRDPCPGQ